MSKIKLLNVETTPDGTIRLQSQLSVGKKTADFILQEGTLKNWKYGDKGVGFYPINIEYEIVNSVEQMKTQKL